MSGKSLKLRVASRFRGNKVLSALLNAAGRDLDNHRWIFILGCYNSGTTLLDQILSRHSSISGLSDEGVMLTDRLPRPEDFGWRRMWWQCEEQIRASHLTEHDATRVKRHWSNFYNASREWLLEKSIANTPRAVFFQRHFQPAYFVHIVRNGYAVAEGIRRKAAVTPGNPWFAKGAYPLELCAGQWKRSFDLVRETRSRLTNFIEITYEDLADKPEETVGKICAYLGIPYEPAMISSSFRVQRNEEVITNMNDRSIGNLSPEDIAAINNVAGKELRSFGYYIDA